ncbi:hypothetical protein EVJ50_09300 [Synechococcus sp. RSCCF101]|uniref:hypothetical protein n=1 Tax=Synechococcus sp. RSCCF101 TaxID=2511069 RepID=UPI001244893B|nr:hypothetical protein [Synechococcus sp. RSCCF101]QEY32384.1 hypothetical protein EVJ50_09300 [Synechococcus sp. RSCCF101]
MTDESFYRRLIRRTVTDYPLVNALVYKELLSENADLHYMSDPLLFLTPDHVELCTSDGDSPNVICPNSLIKAFIKSKQILARHPKTGGIFYATRNITLHSLLLKGENDRHMILSYFGPKGYVHGSIQLHELDSDEIFVYDALRKPDRIGREHVLAGLSHVYRSLNLNAHYLSCQPKKKLFVTNEVFPHIGHYLWNNLSIWGDLYLRDQANAHVSIRGTAYGNLQSLIKGQSEQRSESVSELEFETGIYLAPRASRISESVATTILDNALTHCSDIHSPIYQKSARAAQEGRLILISLRFGNREWIEQRQGLKRLIEMIISLMPDARFLIDGSNSPAFGSEQLSSHAAISLNDEIEYASSLESVFGSSRIINSIGCDLLTSVASISHVFTGISPWGAGLAKSKWICNKRLIVHASKELVEAKDDINIYQSSFYRESAADDEWVLGAACTEGDSSTSGRQDYSLFWLDLLSRFRVMHHL